MTAPMPSHITAKLWKGWIEANPELALQSAERFRDQAKGMFKKMHETDGYVYLVAAHTEAELDQYYA